MDGMADTDIRECSEAESLLDPQLTVVQPYDPVSDFPSEVFSSPMMATMSTSHVSLSPSPPKPLPNQQPRSPESSGRIKPNVPEASVPLLTEQQPKQQPRQLPLPPPLVPLDSDPSIPERSRSIRISKRHVFRPARGDSAGAASLQDPPAAQHSTTTSGVHASAAPLGVSMSLTPPQHLPQQNSDQAGHEALPTALTITSDPPDVDPACVEESQDSTLQSAPTIAARISPQCPTESRTASTKGLSPELLQGSITAADAVVVAPAAEKEHPPPAPQLRPQQVTDYRAVNGKRFSESIEDASAAGGPSAVEGLVALATLPQAISGDLGPIWADSGHSSQLATPSNPRTGGTYSSRGGTYSSVATSGDVSGSAGGSVSVGLGGIGGGGLLLGRRVSRGGASGGGSRSPPPREGVGGASAAAEAVEVGTSQMGSEVSCGLGKQVFARNVSAGSTFSNVSGALEGCQHWEDVTSESPTQEVSPDAASESDDPSMHAQHAPPGPVTVAPFPEPEASAVNLRDTNCGLGESSSAQEHSTENLPERSPGNIFKRSGKFSCDSMLATASSEPGHARPALHAEQPQRDWGGFAHAELGNNACRVGQGQSPNRCTRARSPMQGGVDLWEERTTSPPVSQGGTPTTSSPGILGSVLSKELHAMTRHDSEAMHGSDASEQELHVSSMAMRHAAHAARAQRSERAAGARSPSASGESSEHSSAVGVGACVASSADIAARAAPLLHAPAASPSLSALHLARQKDFDVSERDHAASSSEDSLALME